MVVGAGGRVHDGIARGRNRPRQGRRPSAQGRDRAPLCGRKVRGNVRRVGHLLRPRRLQMAGAGIGLGTRHAAGHEPQLGRRPAIRRVAVQADRQDLPVADRGGMGICGAGRQRHGLFVGRTRSATAMPIATAAAASGTTSRAGQSVHSRRMRSACTTCTATSRSGWRIAIRRPTTARRRMVRQKAGAEDCKRVVRGGSWSGTSRQISARPPATAGSPFDRVDDRGFRVARTLAP